MFPLPPINPSEALVRRPFNALHLDGVWRSGDGIVFDGVAYRLLKEGWCEPHRIVDGRDAGLFHDPLLDSNTPLAYERDEDHEAATGDYTDLIMHHGKPCDGWHIAWSEGFVVDIEHCVEGEPETHYRFRTDGSIQEMVRWYTFDTPRDGEVYVIQSQQWVQEYVTHWATSLTLHRLTDNIHSVRSALSFSEDRRITTVKISDGYFETVNRFRDQLTMPPWESLESLGDMAASETMSLHFDEESRPVLEYLAQNCGLQRIKSLKLVGQSNIADVDWLLKLEWPCLQELRVTSFGLETVRMFDLVVGFQRKYPSVTIKYDRTRFQVGRNETTIAPFESTLDFDEGFSNVIGLRSPQHSPWFKTPTPVADLLLASESLKYIEIEGRRAEKESEMLGRIQEIRPDIEMILL